MLDAPDVKGTTPGGLLILGKARYRLGSRSTRYRDAAESDELLVSETYDRGNAARYTYVEEDDADVDRFAAHERMEIACRKCNARRPNQATSR